MIRIIVVDDQLLVRRGIRALLELTDDIEVVAEASSASEAEEAIATARPQVMLLDVRMPNRSGIDLLRDLRTRKALPATILLTTFDDEHALREGMNHGARGYLLKDVSLEQLTHAIRCVANGESLLPTAVSERVLQGLEHIRNAGRQASEAVEPLTKREQEVLRLMAGGCSNREIAMTLGTAEGTVKNHASSILAKLGVRDRTRAVLKALELGYV